MGVDQNRHWVCHPDRVGDLDGAAVRQTGCHHILGEVSRGISGRAIDLGRILPRERSAAVWRVATIGVHDNLAAGEAAVAVGPADDEIAGRVDQKIGWLLRHPALRQGRFNRVGDHFLDKTGSILLAIAALRIVLGGDHDLGAANRLAIDVTDRNLALRIWLQVVKLAGAAFLRKNLQYFVREVDRRGHEGILLVDLAFGAREAKHHALVTGTLFLSSFFLLCIHAHGDVRGLTVQQNFHIGPIV